MRSPTDSPGRPTTAAAPRSCENLEVVQRIIELTGADPALIEHVTDRPGHDRRYSLSSDKLKRLGWEPQVRFGEGLSQTVRVVPRQRLVVGADSLRRTTASTTSATTAAR